ncbi:MAG: cysteine hydrolase [Rhodospirillaceae bacterium]|nr:cysteine hydrolase [Rhodospirillaceae bacterium]OUT79061.1 MAG: cysteine hydrolase [Rhodospirillaceae bacterium TMED23]|tara:strand:+ start:24877 stop:25470 length:594 start_codon:yes stop_codon:yes gene_type:complete
MINTTALIIIDMQNDFIHPSGAYARGGATSEYIASLPALLKPVANTIRETGGWIVSTHFTLVSGKNREPFISEHLQELRPFLSKGDFLSGSFGHDLIDELAPSDLFVEKVAYSAFYMSRLDWLLKQAGITNLIFGGIVTNGGVASTVRDAHVHGYQNIVLSDGCAAFDQSVHEVAIKDLKTVAKIKTCSELIESLKG